MDPGQGRTELGCRGRRIMSSDSRRRFLASASVATLALAGGMRGPRAQSAVTLRISSSLPADQNAAHYPWYQRFAANLQGTIGNGIAIEYFPNSQLGKEADVVQQVKVGSIDMMITGSSIWATVAPEFGILALGYAFDSYAHEAKALDGGVGERLARMLFDRTACTVLGWASHFGARSVYAKNPITSLPHVKGVKLRVLPTTAFTLTSNPPVPIPTPLPFNNKNT